ncbi:hypothetical protein SAMN04488241_1072 [Sphingomonas rubra]|uniref:Uncharacterized protein n=2 Tax=Sphingomonas rubra TaxID=634430 RepID=A0A1I5T2T0_9SPHN|nr:hypothetical protein SAMN04488241_1072 [Sphingomonas rubra]
MRSSPFLDDPRDLLAHHVALAVASPMEELAAIHIRAAEHHAELAKASLLTLNAPFVTPRGLRVTLGSRAT